jgi:hypothetical protein
LPQLSLSASISAGSNPDCATPLCMQVCMAVPEFERRRRPNGQDRGPQPPHRRSRSRSRSPHYRSFFPSRRSASPPGRAYPVRPHFSRSRSRPRTRASAELEQEWGHRSGERYVGSSDGWWPEGSDLDDRFRRNRDVRWDDCRRLECHFDCPNVLARDSDFDRRPTTTYSVDTAGSGSRLGRQGTLSHRAI